MIIEFTDQDNTRRSATYLPEVAAHEGKQFLLQYKPINWMNFLFSYFPIGV